MLYNICFANFRGGGAHAPHAPSKSAPAYGQQFHQYINKTNNDLWPQFIEHKKDLDMTVKIQVLDWDRHNMWQW